MKFEGHASLTNVPYEMGWYTETIARRAFSKTLQSKPDVVLNINHGSAASGLPVARSTAGTLLLDEDDFGLHVVADLDEDDPDVQLVSRKMKRGDLDGQMSFGFSVVREQWSSDYSKRTISEVSLHNGDVSIVVNGASPTTSSSIVDSQVARAGRVADLTYRRRMAAMVSQGRTVIESRSAFTLDGVRYEIRDRKDISRSHNDDEVVTFATLPDHTTTARARLHIALSRY